jgi:hypothetical protein
MCTDCLTLLERLWLLLVRLEDESIIHHCWGQIGIGSISLTDQ